ncbi:MAG: 4a-hydroxytetrahydrobiopterin dehydratase [bacterium]
MNKADAQDYLDETPGWTMDVDAKMISKEFKFQDFIGAINFVERVADVAEMEGHHPDIHIHYNKVLLELTTHAIGGLSENDFIVAAKIDAHN